MSLCKNVTNYVPNVKCRREKKHQLFSALFSPESMVNCLNSQKLQRNVPTATLMVRS